MRILFFYLLIVALFLSCEERKIDHASSEKKTDSQTVLSENRNIDPVKKQRLKEVYYDSIPTIRVAYVTADTGIAYFEKPDSGSTRLGVFTYGTKVHVIEEASIPYEVKRNGKIIRGKWVRVKAKQQLNYKMHWYKHFQFAGYVFDGALVDSVKADFKKLPILERDSVYTPDVEKKLKLAFTAMAESDFLRYKKKYDPQIEMDSSLFSTKNVRSWFQQGYYFTLRTADFQYKYENFSGKGPVYEGKIKPAGLYSIYWIGDEVGDKSLVDSVTNIVYNIPLHGDYEVHGPFISPEGTKLLYHTGEGTWDDAYSSISLYKINKTSRRFDFRETYTLLSKNWFIHEIFWIDENSFALKASEVVTYQQGETPPASKTLYRKAMIVE